MYKVAVLEGLRGVDVGAGFSGVNVNVAEDATRTEVPSILEGITVDEPVDCVSVG